MQSDQNQYLGQAPLGKLLRTFSIPCIFSLLVTALYNIVDQIFIGNSELGYLGNAATGIVFPILIISLAFAWCVGDGSAAYLSLCQGKGDTQNAHKCIGSGLTITFLISLVLILVATLCKEPLLRLFGASDTTIGMSMEYFTILLAALPIYMLANAMNGVIRADGSPKFSMAATTGGAVLNIILDPIFIFGLHWGVKGAAYATVLGQILSFVLSVIYYTTRTKTFHLTKKSFLPDLRVFRGVVQLGASTFITQMSIVIISLVCNIMLFQYGSLSIYGPDIPISVISIETKVFTIVINIVVGIILGGQPILGYNYGARKYDRVRGTYKLIFLSTLAVGLVSTLIFELCPQVVIGIFGAGDPLYWEFALLTFRIFLSLVTFTCLIKMTSIFFQAVGHPGKAAASSLIRDLVCFVPLCILLPRFFGVKGILFAAPAADLIAMIVAATLTLRFFRKLRADEAAAPAQAPEAASTVIRPSHPGVIVTIAREHGSAGKRVGQLLADQLGVACYYKEMTALAAQESGLAQEFISDLNANSPALLHDLYLSTNVVQQAITAQDRIIRKIADAGSCVIVGRAADYVLRNYDNVVRVFIHAPKDYRTRKVMEMYGDTQEEAAASIRHSDAARGAYYKNIAGTAWGDARNYSLCIDSSIGPEQTAQAILDYLALRGQASVAKG
ncbi:MAG: MATE family efflux transporter [Clostridiales bacterium]|nr:MATE family efflux transporter [Clostridiales bacterium]